MMVQDIARQEHSSREPIGFLFLIIGIVAQQHQAGGGQVNLRRNMLQHDMGDFMHQSAALSSTLMHGIKQDKGVAAFILQG